MLNNSVRLWMAWKLHETNGGFKHLCNGGVEGGISFNGEVIIQVSSLGCILPQEDARDYEAFLLGFHRTLLIGNHRVKPSPRKVGDRA